MSQADEKADKNPLIVMVDESTGEKYARAVGKKGIGEENEMEWPGEGHVRGDEVVGTSGWRWRTHHPQE